MKEITVHFCDGIKPLILYLDNNAYNEFMNWLKNTNPYIEISSTHSAPVNSKTYKYHIFKTNISYTEEK